VSRFDLVIFDCDGVLVDSERLAIRTEAEILSGLGWPLSESDIVDRFVGRSAAYMHQEIERHLGRRVDWDADFERRYEEVFKRELVPVSGVVEALDQIRVSTCVASSGTYERMQFTLEPRDSWIDSRDGSSVQKKWSMESRLPTSFSTPPDGWESHRAAAPWSRTASRA